MTGNGSGLVAKLSDSSTPWTVAHQTPLLVGFPRQERKKVKVKSLNRVLLFVTPWTVAHQAPPSMGFCRQEYWSGLPFPPPGDLPDPGIQSVSHALRVVSCTAAGFFTTKPPGKPH